MSYFHKLVKFSKAMFTVLPKIFALAPTYRRFAEKNRLSGDTAAQYTLFSSSELCWQDQTELQNDSLQ